MSIRRTLTILNDTHSRLNESRALQVVRPKSLDELVATVRTQRERGVPIITSGSRHAMGGQQFCEGGVVLDCRGLNRILAFDSERGTIEVEAGIEWPDLIEFLQSTPWSIIQKQTGADRLTVSGAVSANIHGRGLTLRPFVQDVESLTLVDPSGELLDCSREENSALFRHVVGGYGLFGSIYSVRLRLRPRRILRRRVRIVRAEALIDTLAERVAAGALYGDWQFAIDPASDDFLSVGVCSTYEADEARSIAGDQRHLSEADWARLLLLAHTDKSRGFAEYSRYYLSTDGQLYQSDTHQLSAYVANYHDAIDSAMCACVSGSEMISELFVPRVRLAEFLALARTHLRGCGADVIYGTVRLIEREDETALAWARSPWACIVFNLHVDHDAGGIAHARVAFRGLIDCALACGGSYYLTYHRWASRGQADAAHPSLPAFLEAKRLHDPDVRFQSDWFRHLTAS